MIYYYYIHVMENETFTWTTDQPTETGRYFVETKSMMGNSRKLHCLCTVTKNGNLTKATWSFTNQVFVKYLKTI